MLPPLPNWEGIHPIIVHFPIALLLIAPILIVLGLIFYKNGKAFLFSAFVLMLIGTIAAVIAVETGESAGELAERIANVEPVLENHEELAETARNIFIALTTVFGVIVFIPLLIKKELGRMIMTLVSLAFLLFYSAGTIILLNAAHEGGRLVHEFGVKAMIAQGAQNPTNLPNSAVTEKDDDDDN